MNNSTYEDYSKIERSVSLRRRIFNGITYFLLSVWAVAVLFPFYWMILTSVKSYGEYNSEYIPKFFTATPTLEHYTEAFT